MIEKNWAMILLCSKPHGISTIAPLSLSYLDEFDSLWQDDEYFRDVTEELLVHYKETLTKEKDGKHFKIVRRFRTQEDYQIQFDGDNLDQVYEMLIKKMGKRSISK